MKSFIDKLPIDIVMKIISYTYNFQNKELLDDVKNYTRIKKELFSLYYNFWIIEWDEAIFSDSEWLINDIQGYVNNFEATMYGYVTKHYNIFKRFISLKTNNDVDKYTKYLDNQPILTQINIYLALLTPMERNEIILHALEYMK